MEPRFQVDHEVIRLGGKDPWRVKEVRQMTSPAGSGWHYQAPWGEWFPEAILIGLTHTRPPMSRASFRDAVLARS